MGFITCLVHELRPSPLARNSSSLSSSLICSFHLVFFLYSSLSIFLCYGCSVFFNHLVASPIHHEYTVSLILIFHISAICQGDVHGDIFIAAIESPLLSVKGGRELKRGGYRGEGETTCKKLDTDNLLLVTKSTPNERTGLHGRYLCPVSRSAATHEL